MTALYDTQLGSGELRPGGQAARLSPGWLAARRFARNRAALLSACFLVAIIIAAIVIPLVQGISPDKIDLSDVLSAPSANHWFGTDSDGRDVFARVWAGARVSITVGFIAAALSVGFGGFLGCLAGLVRGPGETFIMRITDIALSVPGILLIIVLAGVFQPSIVILILGIAVTNWSPSCRVAHGVTLSTRERDYVQASISSGGRTWWLLRKHIIPAALPPLIVSGTIAVAGSILLEAALSFLGLGVQPPQASWGNMLADAQSLALVESAPWLWIAPGVAIALTVLAVNFVGDGLRDAFDPRQMIGGT